MKTLSHHYHPPKCPRHPDSHHTRSATRTIALSERYTLIQHSCGETGCREYLGWEYHRGDRFRSGPGRCSDQQVLHEMDAAAHKDRQDAALMLGILTAITAMVLIIAVGSKLVSGAILGYALLTWFSLSAFGMWRIYRHFQSRKPILKDIQA